MEKAPHSPSNKWTYVEPVGEDDFSPEIGRAHV